MSTNVANTVTKKVYVFEEKCCGVSVAKPLINFLRGELGETADVRVFDLSHPEELTPLPPALFFKLMTEGSNCLPAMAVDSVVVTEGWLPDAASALEIVNAGLPVTRTDVYPCRCDPSGCC